MDILHCGISGNASFVVIADTVLATFQPEWLLASSDFGLKYNNTFMLVFPASLQLHECHFTKAVHLHAHSTRFIW
jgi:hypothetical protein